MSYRGGSSVLPSARACRLQLNRRPNHFGPDIETGKTWGSVDGCGYAMLGWRMEEEAKLEFTITVNWRGEDGSARRRNWGPWRAALAARPKIWVCNSRTPSEFSGDYKRFWSAIDSPSVKGFLATLNQVRHDECGPDP
jgi:hypothetical protein